MIIEPQVWDSDFFNIKIGKVILSVFKRFDVDKIFEEAKQYHFRLVYIESDNRLSPPHFFSGNLKLVDIKTSLRIKSTKSVQVNTNWNIVKSDYTRITPELEHLAYESGVYSRFYNDPMFPDKLFKKLYKKWIVNCIKKSFPGVLFVCLDNHQKPIGFVSVIKVGRLSHIVLIAVARDWRKKNIGFSLLQKAIYWSYKNQCNYLTLTTQFNNTPAMNLYKMCGFKIISKKYYYHYWV